MDYSILIIFAILILYFIFLYKLYDERQNMVIENFDTNHCPQQEAQDTNASMEISDSQFIQKEKTESESKIDKVLSKKLMFHIQKFIKLHLNNKVNVTMKNKSKKNKSKKNKSKKNKSKKDD